MFKVNLFITTIRISCKVCCTFCSHSKAAAWKNIKHLLAFSTTQCSWLPIFDMPIEFCTNGINGINSNNCTNCALTVQLPARAATLSWSISKRCAVELDVECIFKENCIVIGYHSNMLTFDAIAVYWSKVFASFVPQRTGIWFDVIKSIASHLKSDKLTKEMTQ